MPGLRHGGQVLALLIAAPLCSAQLPVLQAAGWQAPVNCTAFSEEECFAKGSVCRWFSFEPPSEGCPLCTEWFDQHVDVTGCRTWSASDFCYNRIFAVAQAKYGDNPGKEEFRKAVASYHVRQKLDKAGNPLQKHTVCNVWCDFMQPQGCFGQSRAADELKGVNYGSRFIPEYYLVSPGIQELFDGVMWPDSVDGKKIGQPSLCDVGPANDATKRMSAYLDLNIQEEHFERMASLGFNIVRLPLGYWNLIDLPGASAPNSDTINGHRWQRLQWIMPSTSYTKWIDQIFAFAGKHGLRVMMDLHGAPGGQSGNAFTGCDVGAGTYYFDTAWNKQLAVQAVGAMAQLCARHKHVCYGLELLNEPDGYLGPGNLLFPSQGIPREDLEDFYKQAIAEARKHVSWETPLVIMDWPKWLPWWMARSPFTYEEHGHIAFSTHLYHVGFDITNQMEARDHFKEDLARIAAFQDSSKYDVMVSEYALNAHGKGGKTNDDFDYNSMVNWFVNQFNQHGIGSMIWNFDAAPWIHTWGPVAAGTVGRRDIDWRRAFEGGRPMWSEGGESRDNYSSTAILT